MAPRPLLGAACVIAGGILLIAAGAEALRESPPSGSYVTLPVVALTFMAVAAFGSADEFLGWIHPPKDEPDTPTNALIHGAARPASEAEALAAARGTASPRPAHEANYPS